MKTVALKFPTILELLDFDSIIVHDGYEIDNGRLTIRGKFEDADIELAKAGYKAIVEESEG